jgi:hypothetical protein
MSQTCFVIQPFDGGKYDTLYKETYSPAIVSARFEPYRVDEDASASIPIETIEKQIREASVCFAEISEDNPNVWFEVGLAVANGKEICFVCSKQRSKFPFDVQHRHIITYTSDVPSDFESLTNSITSRLYAIKDKLERISEIPQSILKQRDSPISLTDFEVACMGVLASNIVAEGERVSSNYLNRQMSSEGYTPLATNVAIRKLQSRDFVHCEEVSDEDGDRYAVVEITNTGWTWVGENFDRFTLRNDISRADKLIKRMDIIDDDIPF